MRGTLGFPLYVNGRLFNEPVTISHVPGMGAVDPSMGAFGELVSYQPTAVLGAEPGLAPAEAPGPIARVLASPIYRLVSLASTAGLAFHGYRRNESVGWAIGWALLGGLAPVIAWPVAFAQGFGKPRRALTPNRSRRRRRTKKQRKNSSDAEDGAKRFVYFDAEEVAAGVPDGSPWNWNHMDLWETLDSVPAGVKSEIRGLGVDKCLVLSSGAEVWRTR